MPGPQPLGAQPLGRQVREKVEAGGQEPVGEAVLAGFDPHTRALPDARAARIVGVDRHDPPSCVAAEHLVRPGRRCCGRQG